MPRVKLDLQVQPVLPEVPGHKDQPVIPVPLVQAELLANPVQPVQPEQRVHPVLRGQQVIPVHLELQVLLAFKD